MFILDTARKVRFGRYWRTECTCSTGPSDAFLYGSTQSLIQAMLLDACLSDICLVAVRVVRFRQLKIRASVIHVRSADRVSDRSTNCSIQMTFGQSTCTSYTGSQRQVGIRSTFGLGSTQNSPNMRTKSPVKNWPENVRLSSRLLWGVGLWAGSRSSGSSRSQRSSGITLSWGEDSFGRGLLAILRLSVRERSQRSSGTASCWDEGV